MKIFKCFALLLLGALSINSVHARPVFNIFLPTYYITESTIADFKKACNCDVALNNFGDPQEMAAKIAAGASGYDVIISTGYAIQDLYRMGKFEKIDFTRIKNLENIDPKYLKQEFDPQNEYSIPYAYTPVLLGYNKIELDRLKITPNSWAVLFDEKYLKLLKGRVTVLDSPRNVFGAALIYLGKDPNSQDMNDIADARKLIASVSKYWVRYDSTNFHRALLSGEIWLAMSYSSDLFNAIVEDKKLKPNLRKNLSGMMAKEGGLIELDNIVIPKNSKNKDLAYVFINTVLKAENAYSLGAQTGSSIPNVAAFKLLPKEIIETPWIYPRPEQKIYGFLAYQPKTRIMVNEIWTELKMVCTY